MKPNMTISPVDLKGSAVGSIIEEWLTKECRHHVRWDYRAKIRSKLTKRFHTTVVMVIEHDDEESNAGNDERLSVNDYVVERSRGEVRYWGSTGFGNSVVAYFFENKQDAVFIKMTLGGLVYNTNDYVEA